MASSAAPSDLIQVTCSAPVNIAVVKYWGKRDEELILPVNSSLSATLHQDQLMTITSVAASKHFDKDRMWLNQKEESVDTVRLQNCFRELRKRASDKKNEKGEVIVKKEEWSQYKVHICSENNFPTAAGLASSASGFACLVYALAQLYGIQEQYPGELSSIARVGSGSACRSLAGGFVKWEAGVKADGSDSLAVQVADEKHWPEMAILILVVSSHRKPIGSTDAMERSVQTSDLLKHRAAVVVPERMKRMEEAIHKKDFQSFAIETMKDSNQFHAVCLDTYPPVFYLNDLSKQIVNVLTRYNNAKGHIRAAYTYDAGPNACLYTLKEYVPELLQVINHFFPGTKTGASLVGSDVGQLPADLVAKIGVEPQPNVLERIIHTEPGPGPQVQPHAKSLLNDNGMPKFL
eukprot:TRINITY_DN1261_c0_g2_i1.p1 TRINITY_DN1261_c0_g2~~TRINITY_DN1261_c0_g2_i1.p1  ORF type:complete len:405 (+),score=119.65 TRINITY_DN1261_c0_g2_i1:57-1271(+)